MNELPEGTTLYPMLYPMLTINECNVGDQTRSVWYKNNGTIQYIGPLNKLRFGYNYVETEDEKKLPYAEDTFFTFLNNPFNIPLDSNKNVNGPVRGGRKNKSKKNKSKKYKSKKYK